MKEALSKIVMRTWVWLLPLLVLTGACNHIDLVDEVASTRVPVKMVFDWSDDPTANPEGMMLYIYRLGLTRAPAPYVYELKGREGCKVLLPPGTYAAICHNSDSDRHGFVDQDSYDAFGLKLNTVRSMAGGISPSNSLKVKEDERLAHAPDSIWVGSVDAFVVLTREALVAQQSSGVRQTLTDEPAVPGVPEIEVVIPMQSVVQHFTFIIHHPLNLATARPVAGAVTGMPSTVHPGRGMTGEETVTHSFDMRRMSDGSLRGELLAFGHCSSRPIGTRSHDRTSEASAKDGGATRAGEEIDDILHLLTVQATHNDGQLTSSSHDVTGQIHEYELRPPGGGPMEIVVELDTVVIPPPKPGQGSQGGGFSPTVEGWTGTQEGLGM